MSEEKLQHEIMEGREASDLLQSQAFMTAVEDVRAHLMSGWYNTAPSQGNDREMLWNRLKSLDSVLDVLKERVETGKLASLEVEASKDEER